MRKTLFVAAALLFATTALALPRARPVIVAPDVVYAGDATAIHVSFWPAEYMDENLWVSVNCYDQDGAWAFQRVSRELHSQIDAVLVGDHFDVTLRGPGSPPAADLFCTAEGLRLKNHQYPTIASTSFVLYAQ